MGKLQKPKAIVHRKLGRERAVGIYYPGIGVIQIDPRSHPRTYLNALIHELVHHTQPYLDELAVVQYADLIALVLWQHGYRLDQSKNKTRLVKNKSRRVK